MWCEIICRIDKINVYGCAAHKHIKKNNTSRDVNLKHRNIPPSMAKSCMYITILTWIPAVPLHAPKMHTHDTICLGRTKHGTDLFNYLHPGHSNISTNLPKIHQDTCRSTFINQCDLGICPQQDTSKVNALLLAQRPWRIAMDPDHSIASSNKWVIDRTFWLQYCIPIIHVSMQTRHANQSPIDRTNWSPWNIFLGVKGPRLDLSNSIAGQSFVSKRPYVANSRCSQSLPNT